MAILLAKESQQSCDCISDREYANKNAIFFAISNNYSFAAANLLMSLYQHSPHLMEICDVIVYHNGITAPNVDLLSKIHSDIVFQEMVFPKCWDPILSHPKTLKWGNFVVCKLFGFELIEKYDCALFLDVDMIIRGDISSLFHIEEEIAWRRVIVWEPKENFSHIIASDPTYISNNSMISACNGGLILYTNKLAKYKIDDKAILSAFNKVKDLKRGGIDEDILAWIIYENNILLKELDVKEFNTPAKDATEESRLIHFLDYKTVSTKP